MKRRIQAYFVPFSDDVAQVVTKKIFIIEPTKDNNKYNKLVMGIVWKYANEHELAVTKVV